MANGFGSGQPARTAQTDMVDTFSKCVKPPMTQSMAHINLIYQIISKAFPSRHILDSSKQKKFIDANFELDENGRKFIKRAENSVGKGQIVLREQFLLSHSVFKKLVLQTRKDVIVWERVNP